MDAGVARHDKSVAREVFHRCELALGATVGVAVGIACSGRAAGCPGFCEDTSVYLDLACPSRPVAMETSGPCAPEDNADHGCFGQNEEDSECVIVARGTGTCHIALVLQGGYVYFADVDFSPTEPDGDGCCGTCGCGPRPSQGHFEVPNPTWTCAPDAASVGILVPLDASKGS
jgi:hypothetical protein